MTQELLVTNRETRIVGYFRSITPGQQDAIERILAKLSGSTRQVEPQALPTNVVAFRR